MILINNISQKEYLKYFDWKKEYELYYQNPYCTICQKLHNEKEPVKTYSNITEWYHYDNEGKNQCTDGSEREYYKSFMAQQSMSDYNYLTPYQSANLRFSK